MNNKIQLSLIFLLIGIFSSQISDFVCWLWLDEMECYLQKFCDIYDKLEYVIAHKIIAMLFYFIGLYGFVGSIFFYLEEKLLGKWFSKILDHCGNIFGWFITTIISTLIMNYFAKALGLQYIFNYLYDLINS